MTAMTLPDIALSGQPTAELPLDWVGMAGIDLPVQLGEAAGTLPLHARVGVQVNLPDGATKGIHMSRLYRLLDALAWPRTLGPARLQEVLQAMVHSHADCAASAARLRLQFDLLVRRPALKTAGLSGWKSYPVLLEAELADGVFQLAVQLDVGYSSTCPCSAALARQLVEQAFLERFAGNGALAAKEVAAWLREHATLATPHSQRSLARVRVPLLPGASGLGLLALAERTEAALGTPLQTAVKRADEQAFARLNGSQLMYVEDAARKLRQQLAVVYPGVTAHVCHQESLHPHDAVAWVGQGAQP